MDCYVKNRLLMQFHITGRCNLRCKHCYREEGNVQPLSFEDIRQVISQYEALRQRYNADHSIHKRGHINITGGEPFIRSDIGAILELLGEKRERFSYGVLSNGTFLDERMINLLKRTGASFVQLSIDGCREIHDALRAAGDYDRTLKTAAMLEKSGVRTYISFTANRSNYRDFPKVARACRRSGVTKLWSDRLVPIGNGSEISELAITQDCLGDYLHRMRRAQTCVPERLLYPKTQVTMNRALQFQSRNGEVYSCSAGDSLITVDEFGRVMPCRRLPIYCGDVFGETLEQIYYSHPVFLELRRKDIPRDCAACVYRHTCRGGAKCQSYAVHGSFHRADPACPMK